VGAIDGIAVLLIAAALQRALGAQNAATTAAFDRALPYGTALLAPVAVWLGRCHAIDLRTARRFTLAHVIAVGAICGAVLLLALAVGPLVTPAGFAQLVADVKASHGVVNTTGAFLMLVLTVPVYAVVGATVGLVIGLLNERIVSWCTREGVTPSA
jgi:hypothetical protein